VSALEGNAIEITSANISGLTQLCEEFGFEELRGKLSEFPPAPGTAAEDAEARVRIAAVEEKAEQHGRTIAILKDKFMQLSADIGRLAGGMRALSDEVSAQKTQITAEGLSAEFAELRREVSALKVKVGEMAVPSPVAAPGGFDSLTVSDFPAIFAEFRGKQCKLLWRVSRDGFGASQFHGRCDGHADTLSVILDTEGNIFGGFTPVKWDSTSGCKADDSEKSFLFTLKNPHNIDPRRFALIPAAKHRAIYCGSGWGPCFHDMCVSDDCNTNIRSYTYLGLTYTNDTGLDGKTVFTGSMYFQVKEIEVFEITD
jgi:hypothetical protein